ncbi:GNAT family N-acetyltransferase [Hyunsoonleella sp. SJ7]|uniref:GNAT family N-acetyltransferase n=1 Tax=Hyunsoonleella aquatilis TaxID=2762758 RepID=A0A923KG13_9FLAO|nr:GNAT family N-acetyltransferase [Hyunsoonleella aquatilis]MBC3757311.1 GNAT family N-acetyltransferase [Hyunsoonleella aquatilis]
MKLKLFSIRTIDFYTSVFEKHYVPQVLESIFLFDSPLNLRIVTENQLDATSHILELIPNYLELSFNSELHPTKTLVKPGLAISLKKELTSVEDYLKSECSSNFRKVITRSISRLELSFDISYRTFFGHISKEECEELMHLLKEMIRKRFTQRSGRNKALKDWGYFVNLAYNGINNKSASLFVIYDYGMPIQISLNYNLDDILVGSVSSYDLDYSKFSLGNIGLYKEIEWSIDNNIKLFDIGFGDFAYKRRWANLVYDFETFYISQKKNVLHQLYFLWHEKKSKLMYYLISKGFNNVYYDTVSRLTGRHKTHKELKFEIIEANTIKFSKDEIDIESNASCFFKKILCDYAYSNKERFGDLKVYAAIENKNIFWVKGRQSEARVRLNN